MESVELDWIDCYGYDNGLAYSYASGGTAPILLVGIMALGLEILLVL